MLLVAGIVLGSIIFILCTIAAVSSIIEAIKVGNELSFYVALIVVYALGAIIAGIGTRELLHTLLTTVS